jgi:hypothetical protein
MKRIAQEKYNPQKGKKPAPLFQWKTDAHGIPNFVNMGS